VIATTPGSLASGRRIAARQVSRQPLNASHAVAKLLPVQQHASVLSDQTVDEPALQDDRGPRDSTCRCAYAAWTDHPRAHHPDPLVRPAGTDQAAASRTASSASLRSNLRMTATLWSVRKAGSAS